MINKKGFTLAELLIVVVILGVLGSIALPKFYPQKEKAVVAEAVAMLSAIRQGELAYKLENPDYKPIATEADWNDLGIENPNLPAGGRFTYSVDVPNGLAIATRSNAPATLTLNGVGVNTMTVNLELATGKWRDTGGAGVVNKHPFQPVDAA